MQGSAAEMGSPLVVEAVLVVDRPVAWAEVDRNTAVHLLGTYQPSATLGAVDTLVGRIDTAGTVSGSAEVMAGLP